MELKTFLRSGFAALFAVTHEEDRVTAQIRDICKDIKFNVFTWTCADGIVDPKDQRIKDGDKSTGDPLLALKVFSSKQSPIPQKSVLIMKDLNIFFKKRDAVLIRLMKDAIVNGRNTARSIIIMGCQLELPPELEKEFTVIEFPLPSRDELLDISKTLCKAKGVELNGDTDAIADAGAGLTTIEFADAASFSLTAHKAIVPSVVADIKATTLKKSGVLELIKPGVTFANVGGMGLLKEWITKRKKAFGHEAREYGLPMPKGVIIFGVQGGGKSLATRAIASEFDVPLLRLDIGRLFGSLVGQSEGAVRAVIAQVEAFGRCVLQVDEIDKGAAGMTSGHDGDSGTTKRVVGTMLTWMAEKTSPIFIVATCNSVTGLPPELIRKGRWDEMFFVDLPSWDERIETWGVQITMKNRDPKKFNLKTLADITEQWTGAEIEALFNDTMFSAFSQGKEPTTEMLVEHSQLTKPLSETMKENVDHLRAWAKGRCRLASEPAMMSAPRTKGTGSRKFTEE